MEDDGAGTENLLDALRLFSGDSDDHVNEFGGAERLADERPHADEFCFFFGVFDGDGFGEGHGEVGGSSGAKPLEARSYVRGQAAAP